MKLPNTIFQTIQKAMVKQTSTLTITPSRVPELFINLAKRHIYGAFISDRASLLSKNGQSD